MVPASDRTFRLDHRKLLPTCELLTPSFQEVLMRTNSNPVRTAQLFCKIVILVVVLVLAPQFARAQSAHPDDQAVRQRVDSLLAQMTVEEKLGQLNQLLALRQPESRFPKAISVRFSSSPIPRRSTTSSISLSKRRGYIFRSSLVLT